SGNNVCPVPVVASTRRLGRGKSDIDLRLSWALMASYQLPLAKGRGGLQGALLKGWQINAIAAVQSGQTFSIGNSSPRANTGSGDRPNLVGDPWSTPQTINQWFNTAAFAGQTLYTIGNLGRNTMYGPPMKNLDTS